MANVHPQSKYSLERKTLELQTMLCSQTCLWPPLPRHLRLLLPLCGNLNKCNPGKKHGGTPQKSRCSFGKNKALSPQFHSTEYSGLFHVSGRVGTNREKQDTIQAGIHFHHFLWRVLPISLEGLERILHHNFGGFSKSPARSVHQLNRSTLARAHDCNVQSFQPAMFSVLAFRYMYFV